MFTKTTIPGNLLSLILTLAFQCSSSIAVAGDTETPNTLMGGQIISVNEAKRLLDSGDVIFIDTRNIFNYGKGHLPGALQLSYSQKSRLSVDFNQKLDSFDISKLPSNKQQKLVIYSHGSTGWKSYKAAVLTIAAGYSHVFWFRSGYQSWQEAGYNIE